MVILNNAGHLYLDYENPQPNPELHKGLKQFVWLGSNVAVFFTLVTCSQLVQVWSILQLILANNFPLRKEAIM